MTRRGLFIGGGGFIALALFDRIGDAGRTANAVTRTDRTVAVHSIPAADKFADQMEKQARGTAVDGLTDRDGQNE
jgi:hypothetical protein